MDVSETGPDQGQTHAQFTGLRSLPHLSALRSQLSMVVSACPSVGPQRSQLSSTVSDPGLLGPTGRLPEPSLVVRATLHAWHVTWTRGVGGWQREGHGGGGRPRGCGADSWLTSSRTVL